MEKQTLKMDAWYNSLYHYELPLDLWAYYCSMNGLCISTTCGVVDKAYKLWVSKLY